MLGLRLSSILEAADEASEDDDDDEEQLDGSAFHRSFSSPLDRPALDTVGKAEKAIEEELRLIREVMEKTKYLESKVAYQVKKLVALASSAENSAKNQGESSTAGSKTAGTRDGQDDDDDEEEQDQLSYKPNVGAILSSKSGRKSRDVEEDEDEARMKRREKNTRRSVTPSDEEEGGEDGKDGIYRPPRLGAIPYNEGRKGEYSILLVDGA
jgi:U3 small nucleolar ribonucleoprotein protein LCP5